MASTLVVEAKLGNTTSGRRYLLEAGEPGIPDKLRKVYDEVAQEYDEVIVMNNKDISSKKLENNQNIISYLKSTYEMLSIHCSLPHVLYFFIHRLCIFIFYRESGNGI